MRKGLVHSRSAGRHALPLLKESSQPALFKQSCPSRLCKRGKRKFARLSSVGYGEVKHRVRKGEAIDVLSPRSISAEAAQCTDLTGTA